MTKTTESSKNMDTPIKEKNTSSKVINPITEGNIAKEMIAFFLPLMLGTFFQLLYNTADSVIVGRFVGKEALSAVGGASAILVNVFVGGLTALSSGVTIIVGQYYGAGRDEDVSKSAHTGMAFAILIGGLMMITGIPLTEKMLLAMNTPAETLDGSVIYLQIYLAGMIPNLIYNMGAGILRAVGDSKRPLYFLIITSMVNIVLDLVLVLFMGMGVAGVALATIISQAVSAVMTIYVLVRTNDSYRLYLKKIRLHSYYLKRILAIGIPSTIHSLTYTASNVLIQTAVNGFGTDTVAAWVATGKADQIFWMICSCMGITTSTFVAQNFGAGSFTRVKKSVRTGTLYLAGLTVVTETVLLAFSRYILTLFSSDANVITIAQYMVQLIVTYYFTYIALELCSAAERGMGNAVGPMIISVLGVCGIRILWILTVFREHRTLQVLLATYPISWFIASAISIIYHLIYSNIKRKSFADAIESVDIKKEKRTGIILCIPGIFCLLYGVTVRLANSGSNFYLCWFAGAVFLFLFGLLLGKGIIRKIKAPLKVFFASVIGAGLIFVLATQCMVLNGFFAQNVSDLDYIIVLGAQVKTTGPAVVTRMRLDRAYDYATENPGTVIVVSGGKGSNEITSEAQVMKDYLTGRGIDESRIIMEDLSTNTSENLRFCMNVKPDMSDASVGIVTSNFHVFRALAIARKSGYTDIYGIPAASVPLYLPNNMIRESIGILKDFLMGNLSFV